MCLEGALWAGVTEAPKGDENQVKSVALGPFRSKKLREKEMQLFPSPLVRFLTGANGTWVI